MAAKEMTPLVSIVILNWNGLEDTKQCLEHVRKLDYPNFEIIVVDNGSSKDQKDYLSKLDDIVYVDNPKNRGFAGGQADGYRHSRGDYILLLNNDAVISSDYLQNAIPLFNDPQVAVVGGRSYFWNEEEKLFDKSNRFYSYMNIDPISAETTLQMKDYGVIQEVNTVSGSAAIVRRSVIEETGYLWEPFFAYYEETDLFARIKRAGYITLYNPKLQIWHKNGASSGAQSGSFFFYYHIFRNRYMYALRNFDETYLKLFKRQFSRLAQQAIRESVRGPEQRRIARAYLKSMNYIQAHKLELQKTRKHLGQQVSDKYSYNEQLIAEQTAMSIVVDATTMSDSKLTRLISKLSKVSNPLHEYILVVEKDFVNVDETHNVRLVVDRGYFDTHSINLGCLAARHDWLVVCDSASIPRTKDCTEHIANSYLENPLAIDLSASAIMLTRQLFEQRGGFQENRNDLAKNISSMRNYAYIADGLITSHPPTIEDDEKNDLLASVVLDKKLLATQRSSRWQKILSKYYRLQQLNNLTRWTIHPKISPRLKIGRSKNLLLYGLTLNKQGLATELKHIGNEVFIQSSEHRLLKSARFFQKQSEGIAERQLASIKNIPVFIICFERVNDLSRLVGSLEKMGLRKIVLIDNGSSYQPLLDYYKTTPYQVIRLFRNIGHTAPWDLGIIRSLCPHEYYIVTDPDVIPTKKCAENDPVQHLVHLHKRYPFHQKIGFGLKIDDLPDHYPLKDSVVSWESQFWQSELEPGVYEAGIDTTFALYKPGTFIYTLNPSLRTGEPYTARHMPWYANPNRLTDEDTYYKLRASAEITSWNVDELPDRYKEELKNVRPRD